MLRLPCLYYQCFQDKLSHPSAIIYITAMPTLTLFMCQWLGKMLLTLLPLPHLLPKTQHLLQNLLKTLVAIALVKGLHKAEVVLAVESVTMHLPNPSLHQCSILKVFNTTAGWIGGKMRQAVDPLKINLGTSCDKDLTLPNFTPKHWPKYIHAWLANKKN